MSLQASGKDKSLQVQQFRSVESVTLEAIALQNLGFQIRISNHQIRPRLAMHTIQAEAIHAALWMHSFEGVKPVHINRLLHTAQRLMTPIWASRNHRDEVNTFIQNPSSSSISDDDDVRETTDAPLDKELDKVHRDALNELALIGDIAELPNGRWLPAPLRIVPLPSIQRWMLIGGRPTHRMPQNIQAVIEHSNFVRFFKRDPQELGLVCASQSEAAWCHIPREPLREWTQRILDESELTPYQQGEESYKFYSSRSFKSRSLQYYRWTPDVWTLADGRYLAQCASKVGIRYRIAEVKQHKIVALGTLPMGESDHRRLRYGIDALAQCPVKVEALSYENIYQFQLGNELPAPEHRLFTALGRLQLNVDGSYYPRRWDIPVAHVEQAEDALRHLEIHIQRNVSR